MPWSNWNKADKTLFFAAVVFCFALCLYLSFPGNLFAQGALFCAEAALVGGVADWFAVTALFEKPLGFSWHTALLPRRREEFMEATAKLIRREFFSRRELFRLTEQYNWKEMAFRWMTSEEMRDELSMTVRRIVSETALRVDIKEQSSELAARIRHGILSVPLTTLLNGLVNWLRSDGNDERLFGGVASYIRALAERPETRKRLADLFERMREAKLQGAGLLMNLLAGLASAMDVINFDDLAECTQREILRILDEAERKDSDFGARLRETFYARLTALGTDAATQEKFASVRGELLRAVPLEDVIEKSLSAFLGLLRSDLPVQAGNEWCISLDALINTEVDRWLALLETDSTIGKALDDLMKDVVRRSALRAQIMSSVIVREVLSGMTDEKLNSIVYEKAEPDLLWIRMNGSIVGAVVGLSIFLLATAAKSFV